MMSPGAGRQWRIYIMNNDCLYRIFDGERTKAKTTFSQDFIAQLFRIKFYADV